jgi:hypothetical protein
MLGMGATTASAGEIKGTGELKPPVGKSECAYSGLNDGFFDGTEAGVRTQSYGQIVRYAGSLGGAPGFACNPSGKRIPG